MKNSSFGIKSEKVLTKWIEKLSSDTAVGNLLWMRDDTKVLTPEGKGNCKPVFTYRFEKHIHPIFHLPEFSFSVVYSQNSSNAKVESVLLNFTPSKFSHETVSVFEDGKPIYAALANAVLSLEGDINKFYADYLGISFKALNIIRFFLNNALILPESGKESLSPCSIPVKYDPLSVPSRHLLLRLIRHFADYTSFEKLAWFFDSSDKEEYFRIVDGCVLFEFSYIWKDENKSDLNTIEIRVEDWKRSIFDFSWENNFYPELKQAAMSLRDAICESYKDFGDLKPETMNYIKEIERNLLR